MTFVQRFSLEESEVITPEEGELTIFPVEPDTDNAPIDEAEDALEVTHDAAVTMEGLCKLHDVAMRSKGFDQQTNEIFRISTEHFCKQLGISLNEKLPSLEHFDSIHTQAIATKISAESIGDVISRIFKAFVETMKKIWEKLSEFITAIFTEAEDKRIEQYRKLLPAEIKKCEAVVIDKDQPVYITKQSLIQAFAIPGVGCTNDTVKQVINNTVDYADFLTSLGDIYTRFLDETMTYLKRFQNTINGIETAAAKQTEFQKLNGQEDTGDHNVPSEALKTFIEKIFNVYFIRDFTTIIKDKTPFDKQKVPESVDGRVLATGPLSFGVRFAFYKPKDSDYVLCERIAEPYQVSSGAESSLPLMELGMIAEINLHDERITKLLKELHQMFHLKHKKVIDNIMKLLSTIGKDIDAAEKDMTTEEAMLLRMLTSQTTEIVQNVITNYKQVFGRGLQSIEATSRNIRDLSKDNILHYQRLSQ